MKDVEVKIQHLGNGLNPRLNTAKERISALEDIRKATRTQHGGNTKAQQKF